MPQVLTTNAIILCPHGFPGVTTPTQLFWTASGGLVCLDGDTGVLSCTFITPCGGYTLRSMKLNATQIMGRNVMLATDFTQSVTGLPLTITEPNQTTYDNSTVAPLPATGAAPSLPPALMDTTPPDVEGTLPDSTYTKSTQFPPTVTATFQLTADYPLKWILARVGVGTKDLLTDGGPTGVTVTPPGGAWTSSPQTVVLTMTPAYLNGLGSGMHDFYMTGVTQRGISAYQKLSLKVV
jgi:hypothetical protein